MGYVFNPLYGTFDIDKGHGDILAPSAVSANQITIFQDATHVIGATGNGLVQAAGGVYGVIATGAVNATSPVSVSGAGKAVGGSVSVVVTTGAINVSAPIVWSGAGMLVAGSANLTVTTDNISGTAPITISGAGKAVGGSVNAVITTGNITTTSSVIGLTGGTAASLSDVVIGLVSSTTDNFLRGDGTWAAPLTSSAVATTADLTVTSPLNASITVGVLNAASTLSVTTATATGTAPVSVSGAGQVLSAMAVSVTTATATGTAPVSVSGAGQVLSAMAVTVTTATPTATAPINVTGAGSVVGSLAIDVTTGNINGTGCTITGAGKAVGGSVSIVVNGLGTTTRGNFQTENVLGGSANFAFTTTLNAPYVGVLAMVNSGGQVVVPDWVYWGANNVSIGLTSHVTALSGTWSVAYSIPSA